MQCSKVYCSAVQCSEYQCSTVKFIDLLFPVGRLSDEIEGVRILIQGVFRNISKTVLNIVLGEQDDIEVGFRYQAQIQKK